MTMNCAVTISARALQRRPPSSVNPISCPPQSLVDSTLHDHNGWSRYAIPTMATREKEIRVPAAGLPAELVASATFLLKRLGYAAKEQAMAAYQQTGLHPYHHA